MAQVSEVVLRYAAQGAQRAERADQNVRESIQETAQTARKETGTINRWMQRHQTALLAIGAATTAAMAAIISASPALSAQLAQIRLGFSLLAMTIGDDVAPATQGLADTAIELADAYDSIPQPIRSVISHLLFFGALLTTVAVAAAGLQTVLGGTFVATIGSKVVGALGSLITWIAGSTTAVLGFAAVVGGLLGLLGVWILRVTGVLGMVRSLGQAIGGSVNPQIVNFGLVLGTVLTGGVLPLIAALGAFITGTLEGGIPEGVRRATEALGVFTSAFSDLVTSAKRWGSDLITELVNGIRSGAKSKLDAAMQSVKDKISSTISFDVAANDRMARRWGQDLVKEFGRGVRSARGTVQAAAPTRAREFGLAPDRPTPAGGGSSVNVTLERGAVVVRGTSATRGSVDESELAEEVGTVFDRRTSGRGRL